MGWLLETWILTLICSKGEHKFLVSNQTSGSAVRPRKGTEPYKLTFNHLQMLIKLMSFVRYMLGAVLSGKLEGAGARVTWAWSLLSRYLQFHWENKMCTSCKGSLEKREVTFCYKHNTVFSSGVWVIWKHHLQSNWIINESFPKLCAVTFLWALSHFDKFHLHPWKITWSFLLEILITAISF